MPILNRTALLGGSIEERNYFWKVMFFLIMSLVSVTECRYWNVSQIRLDPNIDSIVGTSEARSVLSCSRYCERPLQWSLAFFFSEENHQCYCSSEYDTRTEDPSSSPIFYGYKVRRKDCLEYHLAGYRNDGLYELEPVTGPRTIAWCDMVNGGWTVIQRRLDGSVDFYRDWTDYAHGFGNTSGEYWIGLDSIHYLTQEPSELYIYMETFGDVTPTEGYAWYSRFSVANSSLFYQLRIEGNDYKGNIADSMYPRDNNMFFSTYDVDNDNLAGDNCAVMFQGGWWYSECHNSNLNGKYLAGAHLSFGDGVNWKYPWGYYYSLKAVTMKVRRA